VSGNKPILPFRLEETPMSPSLQYLISTPHWLDAINPPMEAHLKRLGDTVVALLAGLGGGGGRASDRTVEQAGGGGKTVRVDYETVRPAGGGRGKRTALTAVGVAVLLVIVVWAVGFFSYSSTSVNGPAGGGTAGGAGPAVSGLTTPPSTPGNSVKPPEVYPTTPSTVTPPAPTDPAPRVTPTPADPAVALAKERGETVEANGDTYVREGKYAAAVLEYEAALREYAGLKGVEEKLKSARAMAAKKAGAPVAPPADPPATPPGDAPKPQVKLEPLIFAAVKGNNLATARDIIKADPKAVFARDSEGKTPLHVLAENPHGTLYMTRLLTDNHADVNAKDNAGRTPMDLAKASNAKTVKAILDQIAASRPSPR
jgi:hypothetical protein